MAERHVWRVTVTDNGGDEARDFIPVVYDMERETGALVEVPFYPPSNGTAKHYLTRGGAHARHDMWAENGVKSEITKSLPICWPEPPAYTHDGVRRDKAIRPRGDT